MNASCVWYVVRCCSTEDLGDDVTRVLHEMSSELENVDDDSDKFQLTDILERLNKTRKRDRVTRASLEGVLVSLEEQNKLMFIRDGDDPGVMLI